MPATTPPMTKPTLGLSTTQRRRRTTVHRLELGQARAERLVARVESLDPADQALIRSVFADGLSLQAVAQLTGRSLASLRRRVVAIDRRVNSIAFEFTLIQVGSWPPTRAAVGRLCILQGLSARAAARRLGLSFYAVRRELLTIRGMSDGLTVARDLKKSA